MVKLLCSRCTRLLLNLRSFNGREKTRSLSVPIYPMSDQKMVPCKVIDLYKLSKKVQGIKLLIEHQPFNFKAGQWVDFCIPGMTQVGGYSICSSPEYYKETKQIELAVKYGNYPPTMWIHNDCEINSEVQVSLGGDFHFSADDPRPGRVDLLLVAGGVGINPLLSIFRHVARHSLARNTFSGGSVPRVLLLYCAPDDEDLIFRDSIVAEVSACENLSCEFIVTSSDGAEDKTIQPYPRIKFTSGKRLNRESLQTRLISHFGSFDGVVSFICGPGAMIDDVNEALLTIGLSEEQIKFEKWW